MFSSERDYSTSALYRERKRIGLDKENFLACTNRMSLTLRTLTQINWREEYSKRYCLALLHWRDKDGLNFGAFITWREGPKNLAR